MDSCISSHLTNHREFMLDYLPVKNVKFLSAACERVSVKLMVIENLRVKQAINVVVNSCILNDAGYVPKCCSNLVALAKSQRADMDIMFRGGGMKIKSSYNGPKTQTRFVF